MPQPFWMQLYTPDEETIEIRVIHDGGNRYISQNGIDLLRGTLLLWGDVFFATHLGNNRYQLCGIEQPGSMLHFDLGGGNYVMSRDIKTPEARNDARNDLSTMLDEMYSTPALNAFLSERGGACEYAEFFINISFYIHIPGIHRDALFAALPALCPGFNPAYVREVYSGRNSELLDDEEENDMQTADKALIATDQHLVLLGDSIFDNATYVPDGLPVIGHLRQQLPPNWKASLLAVDGNVTLDVLKQMDALPMDTTRIVISCGGNDALQSSHILSERVSTVGEALGLLSVMREEFRQRYRHVLRIAKSRCPNVAICTIYNAIPDLDVELKTALALFNEVILQEAAFAEIPIIDLRIICSEAEDYSVVSSIEPSAQGGQKIAAAIVKHSCAPHPGSDVP